MPSHRPVVPVDVDGDLWRAAAEASNVPICLSDPTVPDEPLVWVNDAFTRVTGYRADEVVGRNCRFLQGPDTDPAAVARIRDGLRRDDAVIETLLNYRRSGEPFWNRLSLSPLRDGSGAVVHYVGVQDDVTVQVEALRARDAALAEARHAAAEYAALSRREHEAALALQTGLLPRLQPVHGVDVAARYVPANAGVSVGGDWYDVIELPDGRVAVVVGDVMGHDLKAAAAMGQLRSMMRALAWSDPEPAGVIERLDELWRAVLDVSFATVFYGLVTPTPGRGGAVLTWSCAGHPLPLLRGSDGAVSRLGPVVDPPVGVVAGRARTQVTTALPSGSALVLYTDGLIETRERSVDDGVALLTTALADAPARDGVEAVCAALVAALVPAEPADDTCVLIVAPSN